MRCLRADRWLEEIGKHQPEILEACKQAMAGASRETDFVRLDKNAFLSSPSNSIDYAVMEKTDHAAVVPLQTAWSDVGSWSSIWEVSKQDEEGNVDRSDVLTHNTSNSLFMAENRCVAALGLDSMIVVETADDVLVADKSRCQDVKAIVGKLKEFDREEHRLHCRVYRPWGDYEGVDQGTRYQVKRLTVKPGAKRSLEMHHHRAEHWIVVSGTARVMRGDEVFILSENESTDIPIGTNHRLEIIEVQSGSYLGEDDIVRFEDVYNRLGEV